MRNLSPTLLKAQQEASHTPYVKVVASNRINRVVRLDWERLYNGSEDDYFHAVTMPDDGSLIRVRISPPADSRKLYLQRVADPGPSTDFSNWIYLSQYNCVVVATASLGTEVSIFWINSNREIKRIKSSNNGVDWSSPELIDYSPTTNIFGIDAAYKYNGDIAVFIADQSTLYVKQCIGGSWQSMDAWDKTTGDLSGVAVVYDNDWNLLITGKDSADGYKLWGVIYGDGGDVGVGVWSDLKALASAPSDGDYEYRRAFMDKPDIFRFFYIEKYSGNEVYVRPFWSCSLPDTGYIENLWYEPVPFDLSSEYGIAITHHGDYGWLSTPSGVWRVKLTEEINDLSTDVVTLRQEMDKNGGKLIVELRNDDGRYSLLPSPIDIGYQLEISPGYVTSQGNEFSTGLTFTLESFEYISSGGKSSLILYGIDSRSLLNIWTARHQFRWNQTIDEKNVKDILEFLLSRTGLKLEVKSQSALLSSYYPDFTIHPGQSGNSVVEKLLSFVPDFLFIEGNKACIVNPQSSDSSEYSYGKNHPIFEGKHINKAWNMNRVMIEGYDPIEDEKIIKESFSWSQINRLNDRFYRIEDSNIDTVPLAEQRGEACIREAEIESNTGYIRIPANCGQQLYDVIDITDIRAGLYEEKKRVTGIVLVYNPRRGEYIQQLLLGSV